MHVIQLVRGADERNIADQAANVDDGDQQDDDITDVGLRTIVKRSMTNGNSWTWTMTTRTAMPTMLQ